MYDSKRLMMKNTNSNKQTSVSIQFCQSHFSVKGHDSIFLWFFSSNRNG